MLWQCLSVGLFVHLCTAGHWPWCCCMCHFFVHLCHQGTVFQGTVFQVSLLRHPNLVQTISISHQLTGSYSRVGATSGLDSEVDRRLMCTKSA
jgi:hypothetical protein